ncbi:hypothetical protein NEIELOOT_02361 [Neisseria elongata subsp. glycolytica ATCC 29315]|uniref:Uncharacterized protein n=1 Tax=Neisseria elongata subsp. glycolytica ATCC 29315 TaxID=546263 RepID=D4DTF6_NEIEG|nr:hypothetical protein NEIELOOT_02361 [Neisseria elongata subsp. glycolytica ATCC 29315]
MYRGRWRQARILYPSAAATHEFFTFFTYTVYALFPFRNKFYL